MKITSDTSSKEVKEKMYVTLQAMVDVENNENRMSNHAQLVSEQMQNEEISSVIKEMGDEDKKLSSFSYFLDRETGPIKTLQK